MNVIVTDYDASWPRLFKEEAEQIKQILKEECLDIYHIGSTSVIGLKAKPIIDIMPVVKDITAVDSYNPAFEALGYQCMGEFGIPGRRYFRKGATNRTHQIHIFEESNQLDIKRHLAVRDYLRAHPRTANKYGQLKAALAKQYPTDIEAYCEGKDAFVKRLEQQALRWFSVS